ncbi:epimerase [Spirochaetia bacterium]|nr:epimerase [Spirochaetia bacterium]
MSVPKIIRVGITGQSGFIGTHLYNEFGLLPEKFELITFKKEYFDNSNLLAEFVKKCDVIVHLAAINRHEDEKELYKINVDLADSLIQALKKADVSPHIVFSSSTQEKLDNFYGKSKLQGYMLFEKWAQDNHASLTKLIIPNVYGPFGRPNYNSFIATFCYNLIHGGDPQIMSDNEINLIYVSSICKYIISNIENSHTIKQPIITNFNIPPDFTQKVSGILNILRIFKEQYFDRGIIPVLNNQNEINLFNTFCSYIDLKSYFPYRLKENRDLRGTFVEIIKLGIGGQVSFSVTKPGITRGNHFHTRKIERFAVIKGQAKIQIRKIGTDKTFEFYLDGAEPAYVDMPVWYTHNIMNIGSEDLYTQFWINEWYDESNSDTFFEKV